MEYRLKNDTLCNYWETASGFILGATVQQDSRYASHL